MVMGERQRILGIDLGIASCGWAIIEFDGNIWRIVHVGVWEWDAPEYIDKGKTRKSNLKERGVTRRRRRLLDVRQKRMHDLRQLLAEYNILKRTDRNALHFPKLNPWRLRKEALERKLSAEEWAVVLGHMAGHRAYWSNAKRKKNETDDDRKKLLKALKENEREFETARMERTARTVGEWLANKDTQRNRSGDFRHSIKREWVKQEAALLFKRQHELGNPFALSSLCDRYAPLAFEQGAITPPEIGPCTFEPHEPRAAKHSYSFEQFRLLQRLTNIRIISAPDVPPRSLTEAEIEKIESKLGIQAKITYTTIRRALKLPDKESFARINDAEQEEHEIVTGSKSGQTAPGTRALQTVIMTNFGAREWESLIAKPDALDAIASAIAHRDDLELIRTELEKLDIKPAVIETLAKQSDGGDLGFFKGTGHLSVKALRKLIPHLFAGRDYHNAQIAAGYDPSKDRYSRRPGIVGEGPQAVAAWLKKDQLEELIRNQVVSRAVREVFKQVLALWRAEGPFDAVHLEMARDVGRSAAERDKIDADNIKRRDRRNALRNAFIENFKKNPSDREFERWTLWTEQKGKCPYTPFKDAHIPCDAVVDGDDRVERDHILPGSRFGLESLDNKVLCLTGANRDKSSFTPYQWMSKNLGKLSWDDFCNQARVIFKDNPRKLDNLLIIDTTKLEKSLSSRALNDTRWISKFLLAGFEKLGTTDHPLRVQPVNAALVGTLRWAWGLAGWKHDPKNRSKRQSDDRHHAIDAAIVATIDAGLVNRLTRAYQRAEQRGEYFEARGFKPPWDTFREELLNQLYGDGAAKARPSEFTPDSTIGVLVSRGERRRARGQMHKETIYSLTSVNGTAADTTRRVKIERKAVDDRLTLDDLSLLKNADRNYKLADLLRSWIEKGHPADEQPVWKYKLSDGTERYEPIRSVSLVTSDSPAISPKRLRRKGDDKEVAFAAVDRIEMVRIDVFENGDADADARYLFVPIYVHQTVDPKPPDRAFKRDRPYIDWPITRSNDNFLFSIYKFSLVEIKTDRKKPLLGYYRGFDVDDGRIKLTPQYSRDEKLSDRFSPTTISSIRKFTVDRLGRKFPVSREVRTWRGKACT
jgi:CRISPR-associated endonuclease Csn1